MPVRAGGDYPPAPGNLVVGGSRVSRSGFPYAQLDSAFLSDAKVRRLGRLLPRAIDFYAAIGVYAVMVTAVWRSASRDPDALDECADAPPRIIEALRTSGLLSSENRIPEGAFDRWVGAQLVKRETDAARKRRSPQESHGVHRNDVESNDSTLLTTTESQIGEGVQGGNRPRTPRQEVHAWLSAHGAAAPVGWVNTTLNELVKVYGSGPIVTLWDSAPSDTRTSKQFVQYAERNLSPSIHGKNGAKGLGPSEQEARDAFDH